MTGPQMLVRPQLRESAQMQIVDPDRLRKGRDDKEFSLRFVAKALGCSHTQIANYENGGTPTIREDWAGKLSMLLDIPFYEVFRPTGFAVMPEVSYQSGLDISA